MQPTQKELNDSIDSLRSYRNRLKSEIISISQKLRMSQIKIEETLNKNKELKQIDNAIKNLIYQRDSNGLNGEYMLDLKSNGKLKLIIYR